MNNRLGLHRRLIVFGLPLLMVLTMVLITRTSLFQTNLDLLSIGITLDLVIIIPLIYYFLIKKTAIPKITIVPFLVLGVVVGSLVLPSENQYLLTQIKFWVLPFVELFILSYLFYKIRKTVLKFRTYKKSTFDFFTIMKGICYEILPKKVAFAFATEIAVFYYALIYWKKRNPKKNEFTYHRESGTIAFLIAVIFIVNLEMFIVHILLVNWNSILAWILTLLSAYASIQIFGFLKSLSKRPYSIENGQLKLHYGILGETFIKTDEIDSIEILTKNIEVDKEIQGLSPLKPVEGSNIIIKLKNENDLTWLYGIRRKYKTLVLYVDDKYEFKNSVEIAIKNPEVFEFANADVKIINSKTSTLTDKQKSLRYIGLVMAISWVFGFITFNLFTTKNEIPLAISMLIFSIIPAIIGYVLNKKEGGSWKELNFIKPKLKNAILAFLAPLIYFGIVFSIQYALGIRSNPNWEKSGSINELIMGIILGYPLMIILLSGEEIGWRGYLQEKLVQAFGGLKGVFLLGFIWGIWHLPIALQGYNLPNYPILEALVTTPLMCIALSLMIAYFGLNTKSIFIGLLLHTSNNHFGGIFLYLTETTNELIHAMIFACIYIFIIITFGILYWKKTPYNTVYSK